MNKKLLLKSFAFSTIIICFIPSVFALAMTNDNDMVLLPNEEFDALHRVLIYKRGTIGNIISSDTYHMQLKADKQYYFWTSINIPEGGFTLIVSGPGGTNGEVKIWTASDPKSDRKIVFNFTPSSEGDHSITVGSIVATDAGNYQLYVNRSGFAGYWWMILVGVLALVLLVLVPIVLLSRRKKGKKKRKKRR